jgi:TolB-like protein/DNA-binding winged helix-turn-helix (wHTH) protein/Tfp pilus assembly protein PilF
VEVSPPTRITVGDWVVSPARNLLECGGTSVRLKPRAMDVLVYLAGRAGEVVSAGALIDVVWRGRTVTDGTVYQAVTQLRQALGDSVDEARYIETIPKRGYRVIAPVTIDAPAVTLNDHERRARRGKIRWPVVAGIAIALLASLLLVLDPRHEPPVPSIAVLPFESLGGDNGRPAYFTDGIHSELLTHLARIGSLKVISRTSVMSYAPDLKNIREISDELDVDHVLVGSVQQLNDSLRVNVQLIDARSDEHIWAQVYDRRQTAKNIFAIQRDIAMSIAQALQAKLTPQEISLFSRPPTSSDLAYDYYLSGNDYFSRHDDREFMPLAQKQYQRAVDADRNFALAWAQLSRAHSLMYWYAIDRSPVRRELALDAAQHALELDPELPQAHLAMGQYYYQGRGDYEAALSEYAVAAAGMAGNADLYFSRAMIFRRIGDWESAFADLRRAVDLDPRNPDLLAQQANTHLFYRDYAQAESSIRRAIDIEPDNAMAYLWQASIPIFRDGDVSLAKQFAEDPPATLGRWREYLGWRAAFYERRYASAVRYLEAWDLTVWSQNMFYVPKMSFYAVTYSQAGMGDLAHRYFVAAREELEAALEQSGDDPPRLISLAEALGGLGEREQATRTARRAMDLLPPTADAIGGALMQLEAAVRVFAPLGEVEATVAALDECLSAPGVWYSIEGLLPDPRLDAVRDDPRFQELVERHLRR